MNTSIGCCGRPDIARFAALADLYPRSSYAGKRARARLALAMIGTRARALGDLGTLAKVERGLSQLGTVAEDARRAAVAQALATVRAGRERIDPATGRVADALQARHDARIGRDVESVLLALQAAVSLADAAVQAEARGEATRAANEGREPNYSARDAGKVLAWFRWLFGGAFPTDAAESDLRLLASTYEVALPLVNVGLIAAKLSAARANNTGLRDALTGIENYLAAMSRTIRSAVAALPPPVAPVAPPAPPPGGGGWTIGPATGIRCPDGQVSTAYGCRPPCPTGMHHGRSGCEMPGVATPAKSSSALLALPVAALVWYLIK